MSLAQLTSKLQLVEAQVSCTHESDYLALRATADSVAANNGQGGAWPGSTAVSIFQSAIAVGYAVLGSWYPPQTSHARVDGNGNWLTNTAYIQCLCYLPASLANSTVSLSGGQLSVP